MANIGNDEQQAQAERDNQVTRVVGVMSGKGGVGKSLVTALLASAFRRSGAEVGILDADITGPSIPKILGLNQRPLVEARKMIPTETVTGIKVISINLLLDRPDEAVIWRGPLMSNVIDQFWNDVNWGKLDYLFVDMPPGTADVPLTVMQSLPLSSVVIVTSPQDLSALVVRKAVNMCHMMEIPILGLVQNMAYLKCTCCEETLFPFGKANGEKLAHEMGLAHILDLPIDPEISTLSDAGSIESYEANPFNDQFESLANVIKAISSRKKIEVCCASDAPG